MFNLDIPDNLHYLLRREEMEVVMAVSNARKSSLASPRGATGTAAEAVVDLLARENPKLSKSALKATGRAVAAFTAAAGRLSREQQRRIVAHEKVLEQAMEKLVSELASHSAISPDSMVTNVEGPVEESKGEGLGELLSMKEGQRRVAALATSTRLEDWAGPVAGPSEIERDYGTKRSTLHDWQKRGAVIGLLKGERKHVFPLAQFVDGRPVEGMSQITRIISNPRVAWLWLIRAHPSDDRLPPLERLKAGRVDEVVAAAEQDFG